MTGQGYVNGHRIQAAIRQRRRSRGKIVLLPCPDPRAVTLGTVHLHEEYP